MPTVRELSDLHSHALVRPRPGPGVCRRCFNLIEGYALCYSCAQATDHLAAMSPVSYSVGHEQLHRLLAGYKRLHGDVAARLQLAVAAILWRHLTAHERCVAKAAGVNEFTLVCTVPSGDARRNGDHPLPRIVGRLMAPTRERYERLLTSGRRGAGPRVVDPERFEPCRALRGESVLLVDDTWTTGASAQSAAATLRSAGAGPVAAVVLGRYLNRSWGQNDRRLRTLSGPFRWEACALADDCLVAGEPAAGR